MSTRSEVVEAIRKSLVGYFWGNPDPTGASKEAAEGVYSALAPLLDEVREVLQESLRILRRQMAIAKSHEGALLWCLKNLRSAQEYEQETQR